MPRTARINWTFDAQSTGPWPTKAAQNGSTFLQQGLGKIIHPGDAERPLGCSGGSCYWAIHSEGVLEQLFCEGHILKFVFSAIPSFALLHM